MTSTDAKQAVLNRVKEMRIESGYGERGGQTRFAKALGFEQDHYVKYETRSIMPPDVLKKFCDLTGSRAEYILTGQEPKYKKDDLNIRYNMIADEQKEIFLKMIDALATKEVPNE